MKYCARTSTGTVAPYTPDGCGCLPLYQATNWPACSLDGPMIGTTSGSLVGPAGLCFDPHAEPNTASVAASTAIEARRIEAGVIQT
jgi:hypothetical protein